MSDQLSIIEKSIDVFKTGGAILTANQDRANKALAIADQIVKQWDEANAMPEGDAKNSALAAIDTRSNNFLANCAKAITEMNASRSPVTQLMTQIAKMFTEAEGKLDVKKESVPAKIQLFRNGYAKLLADLEKKRQEEAALKAAIQTQRNELAAWINNKISENLISYLSQKKQKMLAAFNGITLADFDAKSEALNSMATEFPVDKLADIIRYELPHYAYLDTIAVNSVQAETHTAYNFTGFYAQYKQAVEDEKKRLIDLLPSKNNELIELQNASEAQKKQLEAEQQRRQQEEQDKIKQQEDDDKKKALQEAELKKSAANAATLFNQATEATVAQPAPEARKSFNISVKHPAGLVEIFQFWYTNEGMKLPVEDALKKSINQMKKFCEDTAKKTGEQIKSQYLDYVEEIKSVNRKQTA